jgi:LysM repeat protein
MIAELLIAGVSFFQPQTQQDSLGTETVNGKIFVIHKVSEKETLYGISRRYGSSVEAVLEYNPAASSGLEIGQILKVPYTPKQVISAARPTGGIVHVVAAKETMFSISKAYNVSMDEIKQWNNLQDNNLSIGQEIVIKRRNTATASTAGSPTTGSSSTATTPTGKGVHIVGPKETLYSLARQYNLTVDQLREWNSLENNELRIGQALHVEKPAGQVTVSGTSPATTTAVVTTAQETVKNNVTDKTNETQQQTTSQSTTAANTQVVKNDPVTTQPVTPQPVRENPVVTQQTIRITEPVKNNDEVSEAGLAELIEGTDGNRKYLALHRTAPIGSILKVRNEMNNREVFVRVTGKLPDTALTDKVVIRVSRSAYDRLGAIDPRFRVQVTYYK